MHTITPKLDKLVYPQAKNFKCSTSHTQTSTSLLSITIKHTDSSEPASPSWLPGTYIHTYAPVRIPRIWSFAMLSRNVVCLCRRMIRWHSGTDIIDVRTGWMTAGTLAGVRNVPVYGFGFLGPWLEWVKTSTRSLRPGND